VLNNPHGSLLLQVKGEFEVNPHAKIPERGIPEGRIPEGRIPEGGLLESRIPEGVIPERRIPEVGIAEIRIPEGVTPEMRIQEGAVAEPLIPEGRGRCVECLSCRVLREGPLSMGARVVVQMRYYTYSHVDIDVNTYR